MRTRARNVDSASRALAANYSATAAAYARNWSPVIRPMALPLLAELPLRTARRVLDVGSGTGALLGDLSAAAPDAAVFGVDRAEGMLRIARHAGQRRLAVTDAQHLAVPSRAIDVAVLIFSLFHLPDPPRGLREVLRVLRPGGSVGVLTWGADHGAPGLAIWEEELDREGAAPDPRDPSVMQHGVMDSPEKLDRLLGDAGFVSVRAWSAVTVHQWTPDNLVALQSTCGVPARRLASLSPEQREGCERRVRARIAHLTPAELEYRPVVLFGVASRAAADRARSLEEA